MKILITGGAGFIGSHLTDRLLSEGNEVVVFDNLLRGRISNLDEAVKNPDFKFIKGDILNKEEFFKIFEENKFDVVFHMAANSDIASSHANPDVDFGNTLSTTYNVLLGMKEFGVKNIVFASTSAIYGDAGITVDENFGPLFPISHYGASKLASEAYISSFCENYGFKAWITRFPNVVGERATHGAIYDFINKLKKNPNELEVLGNGKQCKPYLYVKDLVDAILLVWKNTNEQINFFNLGVESRTTVTEMAEMVINEMGLNASIRYTGGDKGWVGDVPQFSYSLDKIHKLGWSANLSSNEAVRKSVQYILEKDLCSL
ncbi:NAD-dependent epimerase/dehydratase family protein [bacterium]|nr:NAD-dependent epimerase/dehydratase family protein [bacterium]